MQIRRTQDGMSGFLCWNLVSPGLVDLVHAFFSGDRFVVWPFVLTQHVLPVEEELHEVIHAVQQVECSMAGTLLVLLLYLSCLSPAVLWLLPFAWLPGSNPYHILTIVFYEIGLFRHKSRNAAWHRIPFEQEAREGQSCLYYLVKRPLLAWWSYQI